MRKKIVLGFLRLCKYAFLKYLAKGISKNIVVGVLRFCKYAFFKSLKKGFQQENCVRFFEIL